MSGAAPPDTIWVVPCYDEASRLDAHAFAAFARASDVHFSFVDDGSRDDTVRVLETVRAAVPEHCEIHRLALNGGKAEAVRAGMLRAFAREPRPRLVGYWDADLSTPLEEVAAFRRVFDERPDILGVLGSRVRRLGAFVDRNPARHYVGRVFATCASIVLDLPVYDTQCGAKLFRAVDEVRHAFAEPFLSPWVFDVEVLARLVAARRRAGRSTADMLYEQPLARWTDVAGSKVRLRDGLSGFADLVRIARAYRIGRARSAAPGGAIRHGAGEQGRGGRG